MTTIGQDKIVLWFQPNGPGTAMVPFGIGEKAVAMTGKSVPGPGRSPVYGRTEYGFPVVIKTNREAPGDLPSATIQIYERGQVDLLLKALQRGCPINIQSRIVNCGRLNNPNAWSTIDHWSNGEITEYTPGDGPSLEFDGTIVTVQAAVSFTHYIRLVELSLASLTTTEVEDLLSIAGIPDEDCNLCGNGYPGADKILYIGAAGGTAAAANVLYSVDGGGTIVAATGKPFAAAEDISDIAINQISTSQYRVLTFTNTTDGAVKAKFAYGDASFGAPDISTFTNVLIAATSVGDVIQAAAWLHFDRVYIASAGDIYVSTDQGGSDPGAAVYSGSTAISGFTKSPDESVVWAFGATNLILRELERSGIFETKVGPSGGGTFSAVAVAADGTLYAGNGTGIYKSTDNASTAGNWELLKSFGANKSVVSIQLIGGSRALGGDSQLIRAVVDDTAGSTGQVWQSVDGGATWVQITALANAGYNATYFSQIDDNLATIVGDATGGAGVIQRLSPSTV